MEVESVEDMGQVPSLATVEVAMVLSVPPVVKMKLALEPGFKPLQFALTVLLVRTPRDSVTVMTGS